MVVRHNKRQPAHMPVNVGGFMKKVLTLVLAGVFGLSLIGCRASAEVDDNTDKDVSMKKTTKVERDGDTKTTYQKTTVDRN